MENAQGIIKIQNPDEFGFPFNFDTFSYHHWGLTAQPRLSPTLVGRVHSKKYKFRTVYLPIILNFMKASFRHLCSLATRYVGTDRQVAGRTGTDCAI